VAQEKFRAKTRFEQVDAKPHQINEI
jgi:hypothetical protein